MMPEIGAQPVDILAVLKTQLSDVQTKVGSAGKVQWYLDGSVAASGDGKTWATAFKTPQEAHDAASTYDVILCQSGYYTLTETVNISKTLKWIGVGVAAVFKAVTNIGSLFSVTSTTTDACMFSVFSNLVFLMAEDAANTCVGVLFGDNYTAPLFDNCFFQQCSKAIATSGSTNSVVMCRNCKFMLNVIDFEDDSTGVVGINLFNDCISQGSPGVATTSINILHGGLNQITNCSIAGFATGISTAEGTIYNSVNGGFFNNTINFAMLGTGDKVLGVNIPSTITAGNTIQNDLKAIYDLVNV